MEQGAGISKEEIDGRLVERLSDIRELLYIHFLEHGFIDGLKLNQWKFVPQDVASKLAEKDYKLLFD